MPQPTAQPIKAFLSRSDIEALEPVRHVHQHNANAIRFTRSLSHLAGLETLGLHLVNLTQGHFSTEYHSHHEDEEFIYILSGGGIARVGNTHQAVSQGDLRSYRAHSKNHSLYKP